MDSLHGVGGPHRPFLKTWLRSPRWRLAGRPLVLPAIMPHGKRGPERNHSGGPQFWTSSPGCFSRPALVEGGALTTTIRGARFRVGD